MQLRATQKNVVVKQLKSDRETASGILIPEKSLHQATIVSIGPECPDDIQIGDRVVYTVYSGSNVKLENEEFLILKYDDLMAIIRE